MSVSHFTTTEKFLNVIKQLCGNQNITFDIIEDEIMLRRLENAYEIIAGKFMTRGLTEVQISTWRRGEEYQLDIATYWYGRNNGWGMKDSEDEKDWLKPFDRTEELESVPVISDSGDLLIIGDADKNFAVGSNMIEVNAAQGDYP
jgi:hypothetical protein